MAELNTPAESAPVTGEAARAGAPHGEEQCGEDRFAHPALFYRDDQEYLEGTVPFVEQGLAAGEPVAVAVPVSKLRLLRMALGSAARRVRMLDMTEVGRNPGRIIPGVLRAFADAHPGTGVRIIGEPVWPGRSTAEYPACVQHEALINLAFTDRRVSILCPYDTTGLGARVLADARATHPVVVDAGGRHRSPAYDPLRIAATYNQPLHAPPHAETVAVDVTSLRSARAVATGQGRRHRLAEHRLADLELVVGELTSNSVLHGGGGGQLRLWATGEHLVCEVRDRGHLADPLAGRRPPQPQQIGGRGLLLCHQLADLVRIHTTPAGTTVRAYFQLPSPDIP